MDKTEFKNRLFQAATNSGIEEMEFFYMHSKSNEVSVYQGDVENYQNSSVGGIGIRGLYNGVMGYYYSENTEHEDVSAVIEAVKENAAIKDSGDKEFIFEGSDSYAKLNTYNQALSDYPVQARIDAAMAMEKAALAYDKRIESVSTAITAMGETEMYLANSKGLELTEKSNYIMAYIEVIAREGDSTKEKGEIWAGFDVKDLNPVEIAQRAAEKAISALGGSPVETGTYRVIVKNDVFAEILDCFSDCFFAENVQKGFSLLRGKVGSKIANDKVSIWDEPLLEGGFSQTAFDSEGVASYNKAVVENGELKTYLYNLKSAYKDGVKSTGNGFKASYKGTVSTATTNFYLKPTDMGYEELMQSLGDGIIITDVAGLHSGANGITGDFSLAASGFLVENGKKVRPVEQITIASNFFELLQNIEEIANDLYFNLAGTGSPSVIVGGIRVSGK